MRLFLSFSLIMVMMACVPSETPVPPEGQQGVTQPSAPLTFDTREVRFAMPQISDFKISDNRNASQYITHVVFNIASTNTECSEYQYKEAVLYSLYQNGNPVRLKLPTSCFLNVNFWFGSNVKLTADQANYSMDLMYESTVVNIVPQDFASSNLDFGYNLTVSELGRQAGFTSTSLSVRPGQTSSESPSPNKDPGSEDPVPLNSGSSKSPEPANEPVQPTSGPTDKQVWDQVQSLTANCTLCHSSGSGYSNMTNPSVWLSAKTQVVSAVVGGRMPQGAPFSQKDKDIFQLWQDRGFPTP